MVAEPTGSRDTILVCVGATPARARAALPASYDAGTAGAAPWSSRTTYAASCCASGTSSGGAGTGADHADCPIRLDHGYHVVLEGIMHSSRYRSILSALRDGHQGRSLFC